MEERSLTGFRQLTTADFQAKQGGGKPPCTRLELRTSMDCG